MDRDTRKRGLAGMANTPPKWEPRPKVTEPLAPHADASYRGEEVRGAIIEANDELAAAIEIPINMISPGRFQPRLSFDSEYIEQLADNIREVGLNQPVVVRPVGDGRYELIAGENRVRAWKLLSRPLIPALVRNIDDGLAARASLSDNLQRKDITDFEIALSFEILRDQQIETTVSRMSRLIGNDRKHVRRILSFLALPTGAKDVLREHPAILGANYAEELAGLTIQGHGDLVSEAIGLLARGKLTQSRASSWVEARIGAKAKRTSQEQIRSRNGRPIATLRRDGNELRLRYLPGVSVEQYERLIIAALRDVDAMLEPPIEPRAVDEPRDGLAE